VLRVCTALAERGHDVAVICQPQAQLATRAAAAGIPVWLVPMTGQVSVGTMVRFHRALADLAPDILNTHSSIDAWMGVWLKRLHRYRLVRTRHIEVPVRNLLSYRFCDHLVTSGAATRARFIARGLAPERVSFIATGIEPVTAAPAGIRREFGWPDAAPLIAMVSVLRSWKGHQDFIAAAEQLAARGTPARFLIVGDGPQRPVLEARLAQSPARDRIRLLGHREDIAAIMADIDILAQPSTGGEGVPQAVLQAWYAGKPVVATAIANVRELVDGHGALVPPHEPAALAAALGRLLDDPAERQRLGASGKALAEHDYLWPATVDKLDAVYRTVLG